MNKIIEEATKEYEVEEIMDDETEMPARTVKEVECEVWSFIWDNIDISASFIRLTYHSNLSEIVIDYLNPYKNESLNMRKMRWPGAKREEWEALIHNIRSRFINFGYSKDLYTDTETGLIPYISLVHRGIHYTL